MIIITSPSKPLKYTPKGTPRRQTILEDYETEINALYDSVEKAARPDELVLTEWTDSSVLDFVRKTVNGIMHDSVTDNADIFQHGCDRSVCCRAYSYSAHIVTSVSKLLGSATRLFVLCVSQMKRWQIISHPTLYSVLPPSRAWLRTCLCLYSHLKTPKPTTAVCQNCKPWWPNTHPTSRLDPASCVLVLTTGM